MMSKIRASFISLRPDSLPTRSLTKLSAGSRRIRAGGANWMIRPPRMTAIRSPSLIASSMSWVTKRMVLLSRCLSLLARSPADKNVDWLAAGPDAGEVAMSVYLRIVMRQKRRTERIDLREPCRSKAQWLPSDRDGLDTGTNRTVSHSECNVSRSRAGAKLSRPQH